MNGVQPSGGDINSIKNSPRFAHQSNAATSSDAPESVEKRHKKSTFQITSVTVNENDNVDELDSGDELEESRGDEFSSTVQINTQAPLSNDSLDEIDCHFTPVPSAPSLQPPRFRVVKLLKPFVGKRGRWEVEDVPASKVQSSLVKKETAPEKPQSTTHNTMTTLDEALGNAMETACDETTGSQPSQNRDSDGVGAINDKIEQAMDLVKSHLKYAVREEIEELKSMLDELRDRNRILERENSILKKRSLDRSTERKDISIQSEIPYKEDCAVQTYPHITTQTLATDSSQPSYELPTDTTGKEFQTITPISPNES